VLLEIEGEAGRQDALLSSDLRSRLNALYACVPQVSCTCDRPGQCCELTEAEMAGDFATMYPLYLVEFLNIVDYVRRRLPRDRQQAVLSATDERPVRCPFLSDEGECTIHPVRPLACRTYGVLSREVVEETAREARGDVPKQWISAFLYTERHTCCPHTRAQEPEKVADHAARMIRFTYERDLVQMGREAGALSGERLEVMRGRTGREWVSRWSWGGFNTLVRSPVTWLRAHLEDYWKAAILAD
jgi:Fe-S-cluster containining protein